MRTGPALVRIETSLKTTDTPVDEAMRALVGLLEEASSDGVKRVESDAEDVLIDTEVGGSRYLLVRLPHSGRVRIQLSPREQEIVRMVAKGHPNKVIADVLNISTWTVCTHLRRIFAKLGVGSRAAMVAQLLEMGILSRDHSPATGRPRPNQTPGSKDA
jgi:DNA-binding CsgD family transcriptional regulator